MTSWRRPRPSAVLMHTLGVANRWFLLRGLPLARNLPGIRDLPLLRGYFRVRSLDIPAPDLERLRNAVNRQTVAFIGPNHPEFGADWMVDKEISTLVSPLMASWADSGVVAGAPTFWGMNNLVANDGGDAARSYSVEWALKGEGVLLHPEGTVRWTNDVVHPLFPGIAQMALDAATRTDKPVFIVPIVWKYRFLTDVRRRIAADIGVIERELQLPPTSGDIARRFEGFQENLLHSRMKHFGYELEMDGDFFARQEAFQAWLIEDLYRRHAIEPTTDVDKTIARFSRIIRGAISSMRKEKHGASGVELSAESDRTLQSLKHDRNIAEEAKRLGEFGRAAYGGAHLTQEQMSETLKRTRDRLLKRDWKDSVANLLPRPYGPRVVHVGVPEPIRVARGDARGVDALLQVTRERMQSRLNEINLEIVEEVSRFAVKNLLAG